MPFGLCNAPATFQRFTDQMFGAEIEGIVYKYLDDLIIITPDFESHLYWLGRVLRTLRRAKLTINRKKSFFARDEVQYLGFILNEAGLKVEPEKVKPLLEMKDPRNLKQARRFLGMASWYRRYIPDLATLLQPINSLLKKGTKFHWGEEQENVLQDIKSRLTSAPVMSCPHFDRPFILNYNSSPVGLGAVLSQNIDDEEKVIRYASRTLQDAETRYPEQKRDCLAVSWAVKKFALSRRRVARIAHPEF